MGEIAAEVIVTLTLLAVFGTMIFNFTRFFFRSVGYSVVRPVNYRYIDLRPKTMDNSDKAILIKYFDFYNLLPQKSKKIFENRVVKFIDLKTFETRQDLALKREMEVLIAASAIQLTFGLKDYRMLHFERIIIYPDRYFSKSTNSYHLGEANARGIVVFSWKDFLKGYLVADDNLNVGLHEFSHALFLNYFKGKKRDYYFDEHYHIWKEEGSVEFFKIRKYGCEYLRDYAETNMMEFFAVCVECFFETPKELKNKHPKIYHQLTKLLFQNPILLDKEERVSY